MGLRVARGGNVSDNDDRTIIPFPGRYRAPEVPTDGIPAMAIVRGIVAGTCGTAPRHAAVVDERSRRVQCSRCKADLDPFEVLGDVARHFAQHTYLLAENSRLEREKAALESEVRRLREARNSLRRKASKTEAP